MNTTGIAQFRMPDVGEGLVEAEILRWLVAVGDRVGVNQPLVEIETAKAVVELPCPWAGQVVELLAAPGDVVPVGQPIVGIAQAGSEGSTAPGAAPGTPGQGRGSPPQPERTAPTATSGDVTQAEPGTQPAAAATTSEHQPVLVGYGTRPSPAPKRRPRTTPHGTAHPEAGPPGEAGRPMRIGGLEAGRAIEQRLAPPAGEHVLAKPPVRRLARDLGIDLAEVPGTGPGGTITHEDVQRAAAQATSRDVVQRSHVARTMSEAMTRSAFTAPHVTILVQADVTPMMTLIESARQAPGHRGTALTPLTIASLGLVRAARAYPTINSSLDETGAKLILHRDVHLGVAVDSPRGLLVPVLRDVDKMGLWDVATGLAQLVATARAGRSRPADLVGSTITVTNVGVFGVDGGTPILNPGQAAILALGQVAQRPWVHEGAVLPRSIVTLSLSFDHRSVDGALGSRVLRSVADFMADPATALALD